MKPFLDPEVPASAKVLSLVRLHHDPGTVPGETIPVNRRMKGARLSSVWKSGARLNHLRARRRRVRLEDIPSDCFPVILELAGGSNFVIVKERLKEEPAGSFLVQFPDSREAVVRGDRLSELYDGQCVFLSPEAGSAKRGGGGGGIDRFARKLRSIVLGRAFASALFVDLFTLAAAFAAAVSLRLAGPYAESSAILGPLAGILVAAAVTYGVAGLRREAVRDPLAAAIVDWGFIPCFATGTVLFAGWSAAPFLVTAALALLCSLGSRRLGRMPSCLRSHRRWILCGSFGAAAALAWGNAAAGSLSPFAMAGALVLGACLVNAVLESDRLVQELRLATLS